MDINFRDSERIDIRTTFGKNHPLYKKLLPYANNKEARARLIFLAMFGSEQLEKLAGHSAPISHPGIVAPAPSQALEQATSPDIGNGTSQKTSDRNDDGAKTSSPPELVTNAFPVDFMNDDGSSTS